MFYFSLNYHLELIITCEVCENEILIFFHAAIFVEIFLHDYITKTIIDNLVFQKIPNYNMQHKVFIENVVAALSRNILQVQLIFPNCKVTFFKKFKFCNNLFQITCMFSVILSEQRQIILKLAYSFVKENCFNPILRGIVLQPISEREQPLLKRL